MKYIFIYSVLAIFFLSACRDDQSEGKKLFSIVPADRSNITFVNQLTEDVDFNILHYLYYYDGAGIAAGDVNNDGLVDLYFTANLLPNRLYLNKGDLSFEDITESAGVAGLGNWTTGVTMADVNGDGFLDIYVSVVGDYLDRYGANQLFINNGDLTFSNKAAAYGLDFIGFSSQATFFDYDLDGDLDMYLLNHSVHTELTHGDANLRYERHQRAGDRLYRNDGELFSDVSEEAGIYGSKIGYGLGAIVSDLDVDGCPDIYVDNDFHEHDYLYYNNCDGTFIEVIKSAVGHTSLSSMGNDAADFNNDGHPDIFVLDMMPVREDIRKTAAGPDPHELYHLKRQLGYHPQFPRNTLQLNRGRRRFSEIGLFAGVYATDWSWAPLFCDLDNDGLKDLFITTGIYRRSNDLDYIEHILQPDIQASLQRGITSENIAVVDVMPHVRIPNVAYRNNGDLTFTDLSAEWGLDHTGFANGAVYADLDNDGDVDLVVNNINEPAAVFENRSDSLSNTHFLTVELQGDGYNTAGIGAKVWLKYDGTLQLQELMPTRGWMSSVDQRLFFGLGDTDAIDSLIVEWPDRRRQVLTDVAANQFLTLRQENAVSVSPGSTRSADDSFLKFSEVTDPRGIDFRHEENAFLDFNRERLIPHRISTEGPALAVGDVNQDGLDDFFVGGAKWQSSRLFIQRTDGQFESTNEALFQGSSLHEDVDASFFDADKDGDQDLYVVSGGNEYWGEAEALTDRLYFNDGSGDFVLAPDVLPSMFENGCCVVPGDYDLDGDVDLFVGGRVVSWNYSVNPVSYLLENDGTGTFTDITPAVLKNVGMVTGAVWTDYNDDASLDLIVVGEWMPVRVFAQENDEFIDRTIEAGMSTTNGWWQAIVAEDMDGDRDQDLIIGNMGLNIELKTSIEEPVRLYVKDFDGNGRLDQVLTYYNDGISYPFNPRDEIVQQITSLQGKYDSYKSFGDSRIEDIFSAQQLRDATVHEVYTFTSTYAENTGDGAFILHPLAAEAQFTPVFAIIAQDLDEDGKKDVLLGGNLYGVSHSRTRYDAGYGLFLHGDGTGSFEPMELEKNMLKMEGEVRALRLLHRADGTRLLFVGRNNDTIQVFEINSEGNSIL